MTTLAPAAARPARRPTVIALVVVLNSLMVVLDTTVVHIAIGSLAREFHAPLTTIQWVTTGYVLGLATGTVAADLAIRPARRPTASCLRLR